MNISIHAPREGSDELGRCGTADRGDFYPRSPRGERPGAGRWLLLAQEISIHAPREGSDNCTGPELREELKFLSTLPARGATGQAILWFLPVRHFYPRSPRGERR